MHGPAPRGVITAVDEEHRRLRSAARRLLREDLQFQPGTGLDGGGRGGRSGGARDIAKFTTTGRPEGRSGEVGITAARTRERRGRHGDGRHADHLRDPGHSNARDARGGLVARRAAGHQRSKKSSQVSELSVTTILVSI
eukprot:30497-Pelagococcus_subviridis.AAC.39